MALADSGKPVRVKEIAERQEISEKYMEQIISVLNKAGFVRGIRGAQGGYLLSRAPKDYTVGMILRLTEGELAPVACVGQNPIDCERRSSCVTVRIWEKLYDAISEVVDNITLQDLVDWHNEQSDQYMI